LEDHITMARKRIEDEVKDAPDVAPQTHVTTEHVDTSAELVNPAPLIGSVVETTGVEVPVIIAGPRQFRVVRGGQVALRTGVGMLREGKLIRDIDYDVRNLQAQGVELEEVFA
jgi:hypothetical protein